MLIDIAYFLFFDDKMYDKMFITEQAARDFAAKNGISNYSIDYYRLPESIDIDTTDDYFNYTFDEDQITVLDTCNKSDRSLKDWVLAYDNILVYVYKYKPNNSTFETVRRQYYMGKIMNNLNSLYMYNIPHKNIGKFLTLNELDKDDQGDYVLHPKSTAYTTDSYHIYACIDENEGMPVLVYKKPGFNQPTDMSKRQRFHLFTGQDRRKQRELYGELITASKDGDLEKVKELVSQQGIDPSIDHSNALQWAARNGHANVVKYLIDNGADPKADQYNAIRWAIHNNNTAVINMLRPYIPEYMKEFISK